MKDNIGKNKNQNSTGVAYNSKELEIISKKIDTAIQEINTKRYPIGFTQEVKKAINTKVNAELKESLTNLVREHAKGVNEKIDVIEKNIDKTFKTTQSQVRSTNILIEEANERKIKNISKIEKLHYILNGVNSIVWIGVGALTLVTVLSTAMVLLQDNIEYNFIEKFFIGIGALIGFSIIIMIVRKILKWWENR